MSECSTCTEERLRSALKDLGIYPERILTSGGASDKYPERVMVCTTCGRRITYLMQGEVLSKTIQA